MKADREESIIGEIVKEARILFEDSKRALKNFSKKNYGQQFDDLMQKHKPLMDSMDRYVSEDVQLRAETMAEALITISEEMAAARKWKLLRDEMQTDFNMYVTVYLIPLFKSYGSFLSEPFADTFVQCWNKKFGTCITAGTREQIQGGFSNRIFGISLGTER